MVALYSPRTEADLALVKSVLEAEHISYLVQNDHFGSLNPGPRIPLYNAKTVMVADEDLTRAKEAIAQIEIPSSKRPEVEVGYTVLDKIRMCLEVALFAWIMPGRGKRRPHGSSKDAGHVD